LTFIVIITAKSVLLAPVSERGWITLNALRKVQNRAEIDSRRFVSAKGLSKTLLRPEVLVTLWLAAILHTGILLGSLPQRSNRFDFSVHYSSALALRQGLNPYTTDLGRIGGPLGLEIWPLIHSSATPFFLVCFEPLTVMPPHTAYWVWFGLNIIAFTVAVLLLFGDDGSGLDRRLIEARLI
jgi:glycosyl transferase family 87